MVKTIVSIIAVMGLAVFAASGYAMMGCSMSGHSAHAEEVSAKKAEAIANKACPVTGEPVDKNVTYEYKGKVYGFCCPMCIEEFKKDPEKPIAKMDAGSKAGSESAAAEGMHEGRHH